MKLMSIFREWWMVNSESWMTCINLNVFSDQKGFENIRKGFKNFCVQRLLKTCCIPLPFLRVLFLIDHLRKVKAGAFLFWILFKALYSFFLPLLPHSVLNPERGVATVAPSGYKSWQHQSFKTPFKNPGNPTQSMKSAVHLFKTLLHTFLATNLRNAFQNCAIRNSFENPFSPSLFLHSP